MHCMGLSARNQLTDYWYTFSELLIKTLMGDVVVFKR